jgi:hypothetical protein
MHMGKNAKGIFSSLATKIVCYLSLLEEPILTQRLTACVWQLRHYAHTEGLTSIMPADQATVTSTASRLDFTK